MRAWRRRSCNRSCRPFPAACPSSTQGSPSRPALLRPALVARFALCSLSLSFSLERRMLLSDTLTLLAVAVVFGTLFGTAYPHRTPQTSHGRGRATGPFPTLLTPNPTLLTPNPNSPSLRTRPLPSGDAQCGHGCAPGSLVSRSPLRTVQARGGRAPLGPVPAVPAPRPVAAVVHLPHGYAYKPVPRSLLLTSWASWQPPGPPRWGANIGFENIGTTPFRADTGWGCMLRSGQMLLGETLVRHILSESTPEPDDAAGLEDRFGNLRSGRMPWNGRLAAGPQHARDRSAVLGGTNDATWRQAVPSLFTLHDCCAVPCPPARL